MLSIYNTTKIDYINLM